MRYPAGLFFSLLALFFHQAAPAATKEDLLKLGQQQFSSCVACHGPDGQGVAAGDLMMAPALSDSIYVRDSNAEFLALLVLKGIKKEDDRWVQQMLALESILDDEQIAAVLTYVRNTFGGHEDHVEPSQVARWRKSYQDLPPMISRGDAEKLAKAPRISGLQNLTFAVYDGSWTKLPNFSLLEPVQRGNVKSGKVSLSHAGDLADKNFGLVYEGDMEVEKSGPFEFVVSSDDGSRLIIDGEVEIDNDGIHPAKSLKKTVKLEKGIHSVRLEYFEGGGNQSLAFQVTPRGGRSISLSQERVRQKKPTPPPPVLPILAESPEEAVIYRNFIAGSQPRGIAVGYPNAVNLCWNADTLNLSLLWRGDFMDAGRHWTNRGSGSQPPMGVDVATPAEGLPLQVLKAPGETWVDLSQATILYERDKPDPEKELIYNAPHADYQFLGYRLDENRFPTFRYRFQTLTVEDHFTPLDERGAGFQRTVTLMGQPSPDTFFRLGHDAELAEDGKSFTVGPLRVKVPAGGLRAHGPEVVLPVTNSGTQTLEVFYHWDKPLPPPANPKPAGTAETAKIGE